MKRRPTLEELEAAAEAAANRIHKAPGRKVAAAMLELIRAQRKKHERKER
jgi:hypothetical protein